MNLSFDTYIAGVNQPEPPAHTYLKGSGLYNATAQNTIHLRAAMARVRSNSGTGKIALLGVIGAQSLCNFTSPVSIAAGVSQHITYSSQLQGWLHL